MKIFVTDGSAECFFTAVFDAFREKQCLITSNPNIQLSFGDEVVQVSADCEKSDRVKNGISRYDRFAVRNILNALKCGDFVKEQIAFEYLKLLMQTKAPISKRLNLPEVIAFNDVVQKVTGEAHRLKGFLRFKESYNGILYAPYSPDNDITDILTEHFAVRMKSERFIIHDLKRKIAGIYNGERWIVSPAGEAEICLSENEKAFENLWKKYYKAVNIAERPHKKQMKGYMPVRYWKFLPEKDEN